MTLDFERIAMSDLGDFLMKRLVGVGLKKAVKSVEDNLRPHIAPLMASELSVAEVKEWFRLNTMQNTTRLSLLFRETTTGNCYMVTAATWQGDYPSRTKKWEYVTLATSLDQIRTGSLAEPEDGAIRTWFEVDFGRI